jgi:hypothetical protein
MATIGHQQSLVNQSKTIRHLWLTSRRLLEEVDRQRHEAREVFTRMERMGLQQELYGSRFTASPVRGRLEWSTPSVSPLSTQPSCSSLSSQLSQFHSCEETVINDDLSDYHESEAPLTSLSSLPLPPLGTIGNPIVVDNDEDDIDRLFSRPSYHEAQSTFTTPRCNYSIVKTVLTETIITLIVPSTFATTASCMLLTIADPIVQTVEAGDFNLSGG